MVIFYEKSPGGTGSISEVTPSWPDAGGRRLNLAGSWPEVRPAKSQQTVC